MKKLPFDKEERIKVLKEHCSKLESLSQIHTATTTRFSDVEKLADEKKVYYLAEDTSFIHTYIDDSDKQMKTKNIQVGTFRFDSNFWNIVNSNYQNGKLFVFYHLNVQMGMIRGAFIQSSEIIAKERDKRIDDILS